MLSGVKQLLEDLARTPALVCTVGRDGVVSELFLDETVRKVEFTDPWATVEYSGWHIHANLDIVAKVRFAEAPSHGDSVSAFISLDDAEGNAVLRFYFPHASQTHRTYTAQELALFETFKARYERTFGQED